MDKKTYQKEWRKNHPNYHNSYVTKNKERINEYDRERYQIPEIKRIKNKRHLLWEKANKDKVNAYHRKCNKRRRRNDENFVIQRRLRALVTKCFNNYSKNGKIFNSSKYKINYVGIISHLGKCPGNRKNYNIDHITPLCYFNFDKPEEVKKAFAPENHQWLHIATHKKKSSKERSYLSFNSPFNPLINNGFISVP